MNGWTRASTTKSVAPGMRSLTLSLVDIEIIKLALDELAEMSGDQDVNRACRGLIDEIRSQTR